MLGETITRGKVKALGRRHPPTESACVTDRKGSNLLVVLQRTKLDSYSKLWPRLRAGAFFMAMSLIGDIVPAQRLARLPLRGGCV